MRALKRRVSEPSESSFRAAHAVGAPWPALVRTCLERLQPLPEDPTLGFLYVTDPLAGDLPSVLAMLREQTGVQQWVGSVGLGICAPGIETFEEPGIAVMVGAIPVDAFHVFGPISGAPYRFDPETSSWMARHKPAIGVVHVDPRGAALGDAVAAISAANSTHLLGGVTSARQMPLQVAGGVVEGGVSGVLLASEITLACGLSQGCSPIGPVHKITGVRGNVVVSIDDRQAIDVLKEDVGDLLARDLRRVPGRIFAGFPVSGYDAGDYLVRNLTYLDVQRRTFSVDQPVNAGDPILFCCRDTPSAIADLKRMLSEVKLHAGRPPRGGLYFSCIARGANLFGPHSEELGLIRDAFGEFPLVGFFGNGEISKDRLFMHTGVLALFV
jgi:small ligand-binding sensory domain FIST